MVPFTVTIPAAKRDKRLPDRLLAERDGILAWALQGCLEWQRLGLRPPATVLAATDEYFEAEDAIGRWLDECCETGTRHIEITGQLFASWKSWAEAGGEYVGSSKRFSDALINRGFQPQRDGGARRFRGLRLREPLPTTGPMQF
jgi:phage/plasmid-associated DNA primase